MNSDVYIINNDTGEKHRIHSLSYSIEQPVVRELTYGLRPLSPARGTREIHGTIKVLDNFPFSDDDHSIQLDNIILHGVRMISMEQHRSPEDLIEIKTVDFIATQYQNRLNIESPMESFEF